MPLPLQVAVCGKPLTILFYSFNARGFCLTSAEPDGSPIDSFFDEDADALDWFRLNFNWREKVYVDQDFERLDLTAPIPDSVKQVWAERAREYYAAIRNSASSGNSAGTESTGRPE
jgi:hypothetical protein